MRFTLPVDMFNFTDNQGKRRVEPGAFQLMIGNSSQNILLQQQIVLVGEVRILDENWRMQSYAEVNKE